MQVIDFESKKRAKIKEKEIQALKTEVGELKTLSKVIKSTINNLTTYEKYNKIRRITRDLLETYQDLKTVVHKKEAAIAILEIRNVTDEEV
jgi:hypothetical protein